MIFASTVDIAAQLSDDWDMSPSAAAAVVDVLLSDDEEKDDGAECGLEVSKLS